MEDDNLLPNDSTFFGGVPLEPKEQVIERKKEKAQTLQALDEIKKVIEHFEERIKYRDTLSAIKPDLLKDPILHQKVCEVNYMLKLALMEEKQLLEELLRTHAPNK